MRDKQMVNDAEYTSFTEWMLWNRIALQQKKSQFINKSAIKSKKALKSGFIFEMLYFIQVFHNHAAHKPHAYPQLTKAPLESPVRIFTRMQGSEQCSIDVYSFHSTILLDLLTREG